jgi:dTDP-4-amino-4,6-dideoxygalactose transaminase
MKQNIPFFSFKPSHERLRTEMLEIFANVYDDNSYILGKRLQAFETEYALWNETQFCIGVGNGLDALRISLLALGIGPGDEVILPSNAYIACWLAVSQIGATPIPVEPRLDTYNIDYQIIEEKITNETKAIMPVHLYGQACEMGAIMDIATRHNLAIVEDNAQGHGAKYRGQATGSFGKINATSFYPTKNLGALGDGGAITTNDANLANFCRDYRNYGSSEKYHNRIIGCNSRLDEMQAAFLSLKLKHLAADNAKRLQLANYYLENLQGIGDINLPILAEDCSHCWHLFVIRSNHRDALQEFLAKKGIQTMIHYPIPPHLQEAYRDLGYAKGDFPLAEKIALEALSLPLYSEMEKAVAEKVVEAVVEFFKLKQRKIA